MGIMGLLFSERNSENEIRESVGVRREIIKGLRAEGERTDDEEVDKIIKRTANCARGIGVGNNTMSFFLFMMIMSFIGMLFEKELRSLGGLPFFMLIPISLLIISNILYTRKANNELAKARLNLNKVLEIVEAEYKKEEKESSERAEAEKIEKKKKRLKYECKDCGTTTKYGSNYCSGCGKKINWDKLFDKKLQKTSYDKYICDKCDTKIKIGMKYCPGCGKELNWLDEDE